MNILLQLLNENTDPLTDHLAGKYPLLSKSFNLDIGFIPSQFLKPDRVWDEPYFTDTLLKALIKHSNISDIGLRLHVGQNYKLELEINKLIRTDEDGSSIQIAKTLDIISNSVKDLLKQGVRNEYDSYIWINTELKQKITWFEVNLALSHKDISVSGIDKFLQARHILISGSYKITKGVLAFLQISHLEQLVDLGTKQEWIPIINEYLKEKDVSKRDILGCKEKLISAGFKDLAKL